MPGNVAAHARTDTSPCPPHVQANVGRSGCVPGRVGVPIAVSVRRARARDRSARASTCPHARYSPTASRLTVRDRDCRNRCDRRSSAGHSLPGARRARLSWSASIAAHRGEKEPALRYNLLGRTGLYVSELCLGRDDVFEARASGRSSASSARRRSRRIVGTRSTRGSTSSTPPTSTLEGESEKLVGGALAALGAPARAGRRRDQGARPHGGRA